MNRFYLGMHQPINLATSPVPLFVSRVRLTAKRLPRAALPWALDSGAFSELDGFGEWRLTPAEYVQLVRRYRDEIGRLDWAAPMDWACEPRMLHRTGLTVEEHQRRTVQNWQALLELDPDLPFVPVLQGWTADDYLRCVDLYLAAGVDLTRQELVGLGTVCRRQDTTDAAIIVRRLAAAGVRLHGFGIKITGLARFGDALASADSMAWSYNAKKRALDGFPSCDPSKRLTCANCPHYAYEWHERRILPLLDRSLWQEVPAWNSAAA